MNGASIVIQARTEALVKLYRKAPDHGQRWIVDAHQHYEREFRGTKAAGALIQPEGIAAGIHDVADEAVAEQLATNDGKRVTCQAGCSACCRLRVDVIEQEAKLAVAAAADVGWQIDVDRLRRQAPVVDFDEWRALPAEARTCVFLTSAGLCAIYEHRPTACRKYMVVNDPADCDTVLKPGNEVLQLVAPIAEIAFSAALGTFKAGSLPAMVLAEIEGGAT